MQFGRRIFGLPRPGRLHQQAPKPRLPHRMKRSSEFPLSALSHQWGESQVAGDLLRPEKPIKYESMKELLDGLRTYFEYCSNHRPHQTPKGKTPAGSLPGDGHGPGCGLMKGKTTIHKVGLASPERRKAPLGSANFRNADTGLRPKTIHLYSPEKLVLTLGSTSGDLESRTNIVELPDILEKVINSNFQTHGEKQVAIGETATYELNSTQMQSEAKLHTENRDVRRNISH